MLQAAGGVATGRWFHRLSGAGRRSPASFVALRKVHRMSARAEQAMGRADYARGSDARFIIVCYVDL